MQTGVGYHQLVPYTSNLASGVQQPTANFNPMDDDHNHHSN